MSKNLKNYKDFKLPETEINGIKKLEKLIEGSLDFKVRDNHIVSLDLYKKGLTEVPKIILNLEKIEDLILSWNLIKEIPDFLKNLTFLKQLKVHRNNITELPDWILKRIKLAYFPSHSHLSKDSRYFGELLHIQVEHLMDTSKELHIEIHVSKKEKLPKDLIPFLNFKHFSDLIKIADALKEILTPKEFYDYIDKFDQEKLKSLVKTPGDSNQVNFIEGILQYLDVLQYSQSERWKIERILKTIGKNYLDYLMDLIKDESPLRLSVLEAIIQIDSGRRDDVISELEQRDFLFNFPVDRYLYHIYFFRLLNILSFFFKPREVISYLNEYHKKKLNSILGKEIRLDRKKTYHVIELIIYTILDYLDDFNYDQEIVEYEDEELCDMLTTFKPILMEPIIRFQLGCLIPSQKY